MAIPLGDSQGPVHLVASCLSPQGPWRLDRSKMARQSKFLRVEVSLCPSQIS